MPISRTSLAVDLGERTYGIEIGDGNLFSGQSLAVLQNRLNVDKYFIITDDNVRGLYTHPLERLLRDARDQVHVHMLPSFPAGEQSKTPETEIMLARELARRECTKNSLIIALGGGVVGDIAGFVAATYERGIPYLQIPTTLMAQVDSSIGGKTGVNLPEGKNLRGAIYQPIGVIADVSVLRTLPEREMQSGLAELIKYGMTSDADLFSLLERTHAHRDNETYHAWVTTAVPIKVDIIQRDEHEHGLRKILNYGHTFAHAFETGSGYRLTHGEAVGLGMVYEGKLACNLAGLSQQEFIRQKDLITKVGLPTSYYDLPADYQISANELIKIMRRDKKVRRGRIQMVLPHTIGHVKAHRQNYTVEVSEDDIEECLLG